MAKEGVQTNVFLDPKARDAAKRLAVLHSLSSAQLFERVVSRPEANLKRMAMAAERSHGADAN
jgi:hypothetical protein